MPEPLDIPVLLTPRLRLRRMEERDAPGIFAVLSDPVAMRYMSRGVATDPEEAVAQVRFVHEMQEQGEVLEWTVALRDSDAHIGGCLLFNFDPRNRRAEIGFSMARAHWGRGYMTEAAQAVIDHAWNALDLHRLEADAHPDNAACLALLARLGFEREGLLRDRWCVEGVWSDSVILGLIR